MSVERVLSIIDEAPLFEDGVEDPAAIAEAIRKFGLAELNQAITVIKSAEGEARALLLHASSQSIGSLAAAGALREGFARAALEEAAAGCGLIRDDGIRAVKKVIADAVKLGKKQPRNLSEVRRGVSDKPRYTREQWAQARSSGKLYPDDDPASKAAAGVVASPASVAPIDGGGTAGEPPEPSGFDIDEINRSYALAIWGGKAVVVNEQPHGPVNDRVRVMSFESMSSWFANRYTEMRGADGKKRSVTWAKAWHQHRDRRQYAGVEFFPNPDGACPTPKYLNLWRGFTVSASDVGSCEKFKDHLRVNVCQEDERLFRYLFGWMAHLVQRPRDRAGIALVLRGRKRDGQNEGGRGIGRAICPALLSCRRSTVPDRPIQHAHGSLSTSAGRRGPLGGR